MRGGGIGLGLPRGLLIVHGSGVNQCWDNDYIHTYIHTYFIIISPEGLFSDNLNYKKLQTYKIYLLKFKRVLYLQDIGKMLHYVLNIKNLFRNYISLKTVLKDDFLTDA